MAAPGFLTRMMLLQLAVVAVVVAASGCVFGWLAYEDLGEDAEQRALAVARSVAACVAFARTLTSLATTPNDFPASPARAASMAAFSESSLVC